ncbi:phage shock protein operon transcriptional activator [Thaumasiovibrio subtropicus]|uniref:phage shock protein operon transcriptional activator n=1 Tax=Thaumasiovibrio subtropicus TaxID=1891207 RepID=UPI000B34D85B|nr:phage shock protein operon transcriptional activator [Thaumasiovibrio subtropicus]
MTNPATESLVGESDLFLAVIDQVSRLARINKPVLILGERGTGKELIAQRLHYLSPRWNNPLVSINCATISEGVMDSEIFGHESGSFTDAKRRHAGRFERAEGGSLFLDELATCPLRVQEKLLKVIEYGQYERVGGQKTLQADVRLICATNADLPAMAAEGTFRADLLDRLAFDVIHLPPLRARREDILLLAEFYAVKMCRELEFDFFPGFSPSLQQQLLDYHWPGNIRELKNVIERAVFHNPDPEAPIDILELDPFRPPWQSPIEHAPKEADENALTFPAAPFDLRAFQSDQECEIVKATLQRYHFNQRKTADALQLSYHQLRGLLRKHQLSTEGHDDE